MTLKVTSPAGPRIQGSFLQHSTQALQQHPRPSRSAFRSEAQAKQQASTRTMAATMEAPSAPSTSQSYPTEAARRTAFSNELTPELRQPTEASVEGELPSWLHGALVRNGPGTFRGMKHLFDGYAMLVKVSFKDSRASVQQRFVETGAFKAFRDTGTMQLPEFGTQVGKLRTLWLTLMGMTGLGQGFTDNSSVSVISTPDQKELYTMTESIAGTYRADLGDLATLGPVKFNDNLKGLLTTAHPTLMEDGTLINLINGFGTNYTLFRQDRKTNVRTEIAQVPLRSPPTPSWIHDFPVTQNYAVLPETPVIFNLKATLFGGADHIMFDWKPEQGSRLHVVDLKTGERKQIDAPAYFTFHYINSFETADGKSLCFDFSHFEDPSFLNGLYLDNLRQHKQPVAKSPVVRMTVPLDGSSQQATIAPLMKDDGYTFCELPRVNPKNKGKPYRYGYAVSAKLPTSYGNALAKFDVENGTFKQWHEPGCIPVEPVMVPRPDGQAEDDGVVLSFVSAAEGGSFLLVLDAERFEEVARVRMPHGIPYGFHGTFVPADGGLPINKG